MPCNDKLSLWICTVSINGQLGVTACTAGSFTAAHLDAGLQRLSSRGGALEGPACWTACAATAGQQGLCISGRDLLLLLQLLFCCSCCILCSLQLRQQCLHSRLADCSHILSRQPCDMPDSDRALSSPHSFTTEFTSVDAAAQAVPAGYDTEGVWLCQHDMHMPSTPD